MQLPKVTIMIPTYNQSQYIGDCILSALSQDYPNLEVVVSDDASTDNTAAVISQFKDDPRLRCFTNQNNIGRVSNYRKLLYEYANGEWVVNLDGDDFYTDNTYISKAIENVLKDRSIVMVGAGQQILHPSGTIINKITEVDKVIDGFEHFLNWSDKGTPHLASVYNRKLAMELDFYRFNITSTDRESMLRLILHGKVAILSRTVGVWRKHESNESNDLNYEKFQKDLDCIEIPYRYALGKKLNSKRLSNWRKYMIYISFRDYLVRNINSRLEIASENVKKLFNLTCSRYFFLFFRLKFSIRIILYLLIGRRNNLFFKN